MYVPVLKQTPSQESKRSSDCELSCDKEYSNETTIKFQYDCGGHGTYTLFKSGIWTFALKLRLMRLLIL